MYNQLKSVSLFSGIGGMQLGQPLLYCEIDKRCRRVLQARMADGSLPSAPIVEDVRTLKDLPDDCELLHAGFPCIDLSKAGRRAGIADGNHSNLFHEVTRLAAKNRPTYVFFENVGYIRCLPSWRLVLSTMHAIGYDLYWTTTTAEQAGAYHLRTRWFCLCKLVRAPSTVELELPDGKMFTDGQLVNGNYCGTPKFHSYNCRETRTYSMHPKVVLLPLTNPERPCKSKDVFTKVVYRNRFATMRGTGGNSCARGLTKRMSMDLATQLRFEASTPDDCRWLDHSRPNADWCDTFMGFPKGWSDYSKPLESTEHTFVEDRNVQRLIVSNIPNSHRLTMLGRTCVPHQCTMAMKHLWSLAHAIEIPACLLSINVPAAKRRRLVSE